MSGVDESTVSEPDPARLALRLAELKGRAVLDSRAVAGSLDRVVVVGCDSVFEFRGDPYGKPGSPPEARRRLADLSGKSGALHTGHFVGDASTGAHLLRGARTVVHFAAMTAAEIDAYVATGEPLQVAGGFTIDGLAGAFVEGVEGDPHNVVGISLPLLRTMFVELEISWTDLWAPAQHAPAPKTSLDGQAEPSRDDHSLDL